MWFKPRKTARGRIVAVQEQNMRLVRYDGRGMLLTLGRFARNRRAELAHWQTTGAEVEISYEGEPGLKSAVVQSVRQV